MLLKLLALSFMQEILNMVVLISKEEALKKKWNNTKTEF